LDLEYSLDSGASWVALLLGVVNDGSHTFTAPCVQSGTTSSDSHFRLRSSGASFWFALSPKFTLSGTCNNPSPTLQPTPAQPTMAPATQPSSGGGPTPTSAPTNFPTAIPDTKIKVEWTHSFSILYTSLISNNALLDEFKQKYVAAVMDEINQMARTSGSRMGLQSSTLSGDVTVDVIFRQILRVSQLATSATIVDAHADFVARPGAAATAERVAEQLLARINSTVSMQSVWTDSNGWPVSNYGSPIYQTSDKHVVTQPAAICADPTKCTYVVWETFHNTLTTSMTVPKGYEVVFYWLGNETIHQLPGKIEFENCQVSSGTNLLSAEDVTNKVFSWKTSNTSVGETYYFSTRPDQGVDLCSLGLKIAITISDGGGGSDEKEDNTGIVVAATVVPILCLIGLAVFAYWWFRKRNKSASHAIGDGHELATRPPPPPQQLAPGWTQHFTDDGIPYWFNAMTGDSRWEAPLAHADPSAV
jgi:hypothetical protein